MNLEIVKLTPEYLDDFLYFFEHVAHTDNPEWDRCYCLNYCAAHNQNEQEFYNADVRREYAIRYVNEGLMQGYLAYLDGQVVGWCNANDRTACSHCSGWLELIDGYHEVPLHEKTKSIFCFAVAPAMRGKHIATALLERAIEDARTEGYAFIEGYPNKGESDMFYNYVGPLKLYQKLGFELSDETKDRLILRKKL